ncbi:hypothetical protein TrVE_jg7420 [Triparma verrucosa]|uniref:Uncharacterized protein n=1 Tax=Triparma verrucosa TaxID=1606542 RepID=A0A9W7KSJ3_9STRA|nr:hypothetical protein TrVE_jg7420 [Triparma verrucosa]
MNLRFTTLFALLTVASSISSPRAFISQKKDSNPTFVDSGVASGVASPSPLLTLRGGALGVTEDMAVKATYAVAGAYGLQFFLAPKFTIEQNFAVKADSYHSFLGRFTGLTMLVVLYTLSKCDTSVAFPISFIWNVAVAIFGPVYAELCLDTTPMHKVGIGLVGAVLAVHAAAAL